jgi:hypothetical protein
MHPSNSLTMNIAKNLKWSIYSLFAILILISHSSFSQKSIYGKGWTIVDTTGKIYVTALDYENIFEFQQGAAKAKLKSGSFCLVNHYGHKISREYQQLDYIGEGTWKFKENTLYGMIDSKGRIISVAMYEWIGVFSSGLTPASKNDTAGFIDPQGETVMPFVYESATGFRDGAAGVKKDGRWGIINLKGELIVPYKFPRLGQFSQNKAPFSEDNMLYGYVDPKGVVVIEPRFTYAEAFGDNGIALVSESDPEYGDYGRREYTNKFYIDAKGNRVEAPEQHLSGNHSDIIARKDPGSTSLTTYWKLYDRNGNLLFTNFFLNSRIEGVNEFSEKGYAAFNTENRKDIRPDITGQSPWGIYELKCNTAYGSQATFELTFENLKDPIRIREEKNYSYTVSMGQPGYELFKVSYKIHDGSIFLVRVYKGRGFFRPEELTYQEANGVSFYDALDALKVVIDQLIFSLKPHLLFQKAGPESIELKPGVLIYVNGINKPASSGYQIITSPEGQTYQGEMNGGNMEGFGKYTYKNGIVHYGQFSDNSINGWGLRVFPNGNCHLGLFRNGQEDGFGIFRYAIGNTAKGNFKEGKAEGRMLRKMVDGQIEWIELANSNVASNEVLRQRPDFGGIGISFKYNSVKKGFYVEKIALGLPADQVGMKPDDRIVKVDGKTLTGKDTKKVAEMLKGPDGSIVQVTIERNGLQKDFSITRKRIDADKLSEKLYDGI